MERRSPPDSFFSRRCIGTLPTLRKPGATTAARKNLREILRRAPFAKSLRASRMTAAAFWMAALLGVFDHGFWADYYYYAVFCNRVAGPRSRLLYLRASLRDGRLWRGECGNCGLRSRD